MNPRTMLLPLFALAVIASSVAAPARGVEDWSYQRLFQQSDLIVIAYPVTSEPTADRTKDNPWKVELRGVNTRFRVEYVLKGKPDLLNVTVLHYTSDMAIADGPTLVSFRTNGLSYTIKTDKGTTAAVSEGGPSTYLLFLRQRGDGRFEPVSGQTDAALSVRQIRTPTGFDIDE